MDKDMKIKQQKEANVIDFSKLNADIKKHRKLYYKVLPITFVISAILMFSIPNYYKCEVMLAPELSRSGSASSLTSLASSFGLKLASGSSGGEALFPTLYPDLMNNVDFKVSLFQVPVTIEGNKDEEEPDRTLTYYNYLRDEQKEPWWSAAISGTKGWLISLIKEPTPQDTMVNPFRLTKEQTDIVNVIDKNVICDVDQKTLVITITVKDQNPLICATMADTVKMRLQNFITDYRTSKARVDLDYNRKLYAETKSRYEKARQLYAEFMDANNDVILQTVRQKQTDLENEMQLQYNAYTQIAAQLTAAEAKVQEETPAFTTLQSATVPIKKAGPARIKMILVFLFLACICTTVWILYKEEDLKPLLGLN